MKPVATLNVCMTRERESTMKKLKQALKEMDATPTQWKMAFILYHINGLESALGFVEKIKNHNGGQLNLL